MEKKIEILNFWYGNDPTQFNKWWFNSDQIIDSNIYDMFSDDLIRLYYNFDLTKYQTAPVDILLTDIILLDQVSRHCDRVEPLAFDIIDSTKKAAQISQIWINKKYHLTQPFGYTAFAFLPIRHLKNKNDINNLMELLDSIYSHNPDIESNTIFSKFKIHTKRSLNL